MKNLNDSLISERDFATNKDNVDKDIEEPERSILSESMENREELASIDKHLSRSSHEHF